MQLEYSETDQTSIEDEIPVLIISAFTPPEKETLGYVQYIQDLDVLSDKEGIGIPESYAIATSKQAGNNSRHKLQQALIHEQSKNSYGYKASSTVRFLGLTNNYDMNGVFIRRS